MKHHMLWKTLCFGLLAVGFILLAVSGSTLHSRALLRNGVHSPGVVIGYEQQDSHDGTAVRYAPRVRFETSAGRQVEFKASDSELREYQVNAAVIVVYDPRDPSDAMLKTEAASQSSEVDSPIPGGIALLLGGAGFAIYLLLNRRIKYQRREVSL